MRWFKHASIASDDELMSELMDRFGAEGYGVYWIICERIARLMDDSNRCYATFSLKKWSEFCRISSKKFQTLIKFLEKKNRLILKNDEGLISIEYPNLLKYKDEYTKKCAKNKQKTPDNVLTNSNTIAGESHHQKKNIEEEGEDIKANNHKEHGCLSTAEKIDSCPHDKIINIYHEILPMCPRVLIKTKNRQEHTRARWKEYPDLRYWEQFFRSVTQSKFLTGKRSARDGRAFVASFDWLVKPENFAKVLEGRYSDEQK